jgi:Mg-chelatase subunit ChlD
LSNVPEQPVTALKDAVDIMMDYLEDLDTDEWVGLATYDDSSRVELNLSTDTAAVANRMRALAAGYYSRNTNIGGGMSRGRTILNSGGRATARKTMVLMTDGLANVGSGGYSPSAYVIYQAQQAAAEGITIHTVSFTSDADEALMAQVAEIGKGMHFHVPNYNVEQYTEDLEEVFLTISSMRPLVLSE